MKINKTKKNYTYLFTLFVQFVKVIVKKKNIKVKHFVVYNNAELTDYFTCREKGLEYF